MQFGTFPISLQADTAVATVYLAYILEMKYCKIRKFTIHVVCGPIQYARDLHPGVLRAAAESSLKNKNRERERERQRF